MELIVRSQPIFSCSLQGWEIPVSVQAAHEAIGNRSQERLVILEAPLCPRMLDVRETNELLYEPALKSLWTSGVP